jgi:hypothetical protein
MLGEVLGKFFLERQEGEGRMALKRIVGRYILRIRVV